MTIPALGFLDRSIFAATSAGIGPFVFASAVPGFQSPVAAGVVNGVQYGYAAQSADLSQWEYGYGTWSINTLTRTVLGNNLNTTSPINFGAAPNVLITLLAESMAQIAAGALVMAPSNLDFYISPTGSDSNPGTIAQPFFTLDRASVAAAGFDYGGLFQPTIHIAAGSYNYTTTQLLTNLTNCPTGGRVIGAGYTITTLNDINFNGGILAQGPFANWTIDGITVNSDNYCFQALDLATIFFRGLGFNAIGVQGTFLSPADTEYFVTNSDGTIDSLFMNINVLTTTGLGVFVSFGAPSFFIVRFSTIVLPVGFNMAANGGFFLDTTGACTFQFTGTTFVNAGSAVGSRADLAASHGITTLITNNGVITDIPGTGPDLLDNTVILTIQSALAPTCAALALAAIAGPPLNAANFSAGTFGVFKDTNQPTGGGVGLYYDDAGTISNIGYIKAASNLSWFVAATGSDSNPGTVGLPFLTIQHALNVAAAYDWQFKFRPTITVAAATYTPSTRINLPQLRNIASAGSSPTATVGLLIGAGYATTKIKVSGDNAVYGAGYESIWGLEEITFDSDQSAISCEYGAQIFLFANVGVDNTVTGTGSRLFSSGNGGAAIGVWISANLHVLATNFAYFYQNSGGEGVFFATTATITLPVACTITGAFVGNFNNGSLGFGIGRFTSIVNAGGVTGAQITTQAGGGLSEFSTPNGLISDIPGQATNNTYDNYTTFLSRIGGTQAALVWPMSGVPTTTQLPPDGWGVFKDTGTGNVYVATNVAGTIKKVQLT